MVVNYRPKKDDPYRTRLTAGENNISHPGDCGTPTVDLLTVKLLLNSVVSTPDAKFITINIKNFYLNTPMQQFKYMKLKLNNLPANFVKHYNLNAKLTKYVYVFAEIIKGMYGLPQADTLAQKLLETRLNKEGYRQSTLIWGYLDTRLATHHVHIVRGRLWCQVHGQITLPSPHEHSQQPL